MRVVGLAADHVIDENRVQMNDNRKELQRTLDWKFFLMLVATLASVIVPVWLWQAEQQAHSMVLQRVSITSLQPQNMPTVKDLRITLNGQELDSPYLTVFDLKNNGSRPIPQSDFEVPVEINAKEPVRIVSVELASVKPNDLKPIISSHDGGITIQPLLLNPSDTLRMTAVTTGGNPEFSIRARISGIQRIDIDDKTTTSKSRARMWIGGLIGIFLVILSTGSYSEFVLTFYKQRRLVPKPFVIAMTTLMGGALLLTPFVEVYSLSLLQFILIGVVPGLISIFLNIGYLRKREFSAIEE